MPQDEFTRQRDIENTQMNYQRDRYGDNYVYMDAEIDRSLHTERY